MFLKRTGPLLLVLVLGILSMIQYFVPHKISQDFYRISLKWWQGVVAMSIIMALLSLIRRHVRRIKRGEGVVYSATTLTGLGLMLFVGFIGGIGPNSLFQKLYLNIQVPLDATMFSLLAFYMSSAAYRAFRARTFEATLLLLAAFIIMFGMTPFANYIRGGPEFTQWILEVPNLAQKRGILIGVGLGAAATSLKIIFGIERNWIGG